MRLLRASPHPSQAPACSSQQPLHSTEPFYRGFPTGGEGESHKIKIMKSFKNGKRKKKKPKQTEIIPSRFLSEGSLPHQPGPSAPSPGASPNRSPGAIRTQRRLRQGRSPPEAQRALQHGSAPRGDARDPAGTPLSPPPTPSEEPTSAGRLPAAASPRHHHPHSHLPEGTTPRCSEEERRTEGDPSGIAAAPCPNRTITTTPRDAPTAASGPFPRL